MRIVWKPRLKKYEFVNKVKVFWPRPDDAFKVKPMVIPDRILRGNIPMEVMDGPRLNSKMATQIHRSFHQNYSVSQNVSF